MTLAHRSDFDPNKLEEILNLANTLSLAIGGAKARHMLSEGMAESLQVAADKLADEISALKTQTAITSN